MNQDCFAALYGSNGRWLGLVLDGHGKHGHSVAQELSVVLPILVEEAMQCGSDPTVAFTEAFEAAEEELKRAAWRLNCSISGAHGIDLSSSGAAVAAVLLDPLEGVAHIASCGDSQAMIVDLDSGEFTASRPHKPHEAGERERITAAGGTVVVERTRPDGEVSSRVCPPGSEKGLGMSRAFGDLSLKRHGVVAAPSVVTVQLPRRAGCAIGSDGLFEFLKPSEVATAVCKDLEREGGDFCAEALVSEATRRWDYRTRGSYCDDVTCLLVGTALPE